MQLSFLPADILLHRIDPPANARRYYRMTLEPDMFGGCALVREWGRIGRSCARRVELHASEGKAQDRLNELLRAKSGRGYVTIERQVPCPSPNTSPTPWSRHRPTKPPAR